MPKNPSNPKSSKPQDPESRFSRARVSRTLNTREKNAQTRLKKQQKKRNRDTILNTPVLTLPVFLRKFVELMLLSTIIGAAAAYNLGFEQETLTKYIRWVAENNNQTTPGVSSPYIWRFFQDLTYMFNSHLPVLELKSLVFLMLSGLMVGAHLSARIFEALTKRPVFAPDPNASNGKKIDQRRLFTLGAIMLFLGWSFLSFSSWGWGPKMPLEAISETETSITGGSFSALVSWLMVLVGLIGFISAEDIIRTRKMVYKIIGLVIFLGVMASLISLIIQTDTGYITQFLMKWSANDIRNDVGGFIGHNTAVSSYMIAPFFLCWALLMSHNKSPLWIRLLLIACLTMFALILLLAQSRAVIPIMAVCFVWVVYQLGRKASLKVPMSYVVGAPLIIVALVLTQFVDTRMNPLFRDSAPLEERLDHVTLKHLQTETRLRILLASLPAVAEHPLLGYGFHSFPYVYPVVQGEYFTQDRNFYIAPTNKRTARAHNEYLQTLFETGLIGLGLALAALCTVLIGGWRVLTVSLRQRHVAIQLGLFASIIGILMHCAFDFPLRVAPVCSVLLLLLAVWSAGDRLWSIKAKPLEDRPLNDQEADKLLKLELKTKQEFKSPKVLLAGWSMITMFIISGFVIFAAKGATWFVTPTMTLESMLKLKAIAGAPISPETKLRAISDVEQELSIGHRLSPLDGECLNLMSKLEYQKALQHLTLQNSAMAEQNETAAFAQNARAKIAVNDSIDLLKRSLSEYSFHGSYFSLALMKSTLARVDPQDESAMGEAIILMRKCVDMNPGYSDGILTLIEWTKRFQPQQLAEIPALYKTLRTFHEPTFQERIVAVILYQIAAGKTDEALTNAALLAEAFPDEPLFQGIMFTVAISENELGAATLASNSIPANLNSHLRIQRAKIAIKRTEWDVALHELSVKQRNADQDSELRQLILKRLTEAYIAKLDGDDEAMKIAIINIKNLGENEQYNLFISGRLLHQVFNELDGAIECYQDALSLKQQSDPMQSVYLANMLQEKYQKVIDKVSRQQMSAFREGLPRSEWPFISDKEARPELIEALNLIADSINVYSKFPDFRMRFMTNDLTNDARKLQILLQPDAS